MMKVVGATRMVISTVISILTTQIMVNSFLIAGIPILPLLIPLIVGGQLEGMIQQW
jgi:hypothetical protein